MAYNKVFHLFHSMENHIITGGQSQDTSTQPYKRYSQFLTEIESYVHSIIHNKNTQSNTNIHHLQLNHYTPSIESIHSLSQSQSQSTTRNEHISQSQSTTRNERISQSQSTTRNERISQFISKQSNISSSQLSRGKGRLLV